MVKIMHRQMCSVNMTHLLNNIKSTYLKLMLLEPSIPPQVHMSDTRHSNMGGTLGNFNLSQKKFIISTSS